MTIPLQSEAHFWWQVQGLMFHRSNVFYFWPDFLFMQYNCSWYIALLRSDHRTPMALNNCAWRTFSRSRIHSNCPSGGSNTYPPSYRLSALTLWVLCPTFAPEEIFLLQLKHINSNNNYLVWHRGIGTKQFVAKAGIQFFSFVSCRKLCQLLPLNTWRYMHVWGQPLIHFQLITILINNQTVPISD